MATILVVEDDLRFARLLENILGPCGHTVIHAATALGGLDLAERNRIEMVLLDLDLPDLDGKVVATALRARPGMREIPIIAVSAQDDALTRRLVKAFGCNAFIGKPIDTRAFVDRIAAFLDKH
jgi:DNA-binding response OmpR family regulator